MRVLVCGGRDFSDRNLLIRTLDKFCEDRGLVTPVEKRPSCGNYMPENITIVHGAARGADRMAADWAVVNWVPQEAHPADWDKHGRAAGPIRNAEMLKTGIDVVIAFPGGRGTAHMISIAEKAGVEVLVVE